MLVQMEQPRRKALSQPQRIDEPLDAAHVVRYLLQQTASGRNVLLLRADLIVQFAQAFHHFAQQRRLLNDQLLQQRGIAGCAFAARKLFVGRSEIEMGTHGCFLA
jgi:hypothetical protein